ncbi:hypothetical protein BDZ91DRAFT_764887 [Kalaharituber pfeilii]|nr:hypothetical protein BDZ91DRAFT_764887 [Kalaharituber pfeilii]
MYTPKLSICQVLKAKRASMNLWFLFGMNSFAFTNADPCMTLIREQCRILDIVRAKLDGPPTASKQRGVLQAYLTLGIENIQQKKRYWYLASGVSNCICLSPPTTWWINVKARTAMIFQNENWNEDARGTWDIFLLHIRR